MADRLAVAHVNAPVDLQADRVARILLLLAAGTLLGLALPLLVQGAPLADDFPNCTLPASRGLTAFLGESVARLGVVRPARFIEILVTTGVCQTLPFGVALGVPLVLTFGVALALARLLVLVGAPPAWATVGAALWLLQPLGTEAALWPASLHVPLGLCLALVAIIAAWHGRIVLACLAALGAYFSAEQTILVLPLAALFLVPPDRRRRASISLGVGALLVGVAYVLAQGNDPRLALPLGQRLLAMFVDPAFYVLYPGVGLGIHSIPLAIAWGLPWSLIGLTVAAGLAARWGPSLLWASCRPPRAGWPIAVAAWLALVATANLPVLVSLPHQGSPRIFTPTWLLVCAGVALAAPRLRWPEPRLAAALAGLYLAGAAMSLVWSAWVRYTSAEFVEAASLRLAPRLHTGGLVVLCDVPRTVVTPAPRGAFAVHDFLFDWSAAGAMEYYTGVRPVFRIVVEQEACPTDANATVVHFSELGPV